jgi:dUTP pyrophosphatase
VSKYRMAYFAYPIDQGGGGQMASVYEFIEHVKSHLLGSVFEVIFDPGDAFTITLGAPVGFEVEAVNRTAQESASATVAFLPKGVPTIGAAFEVERSASRGKPTLIFTDNANSWSLGDLATRPNCKIVGLDDDGLAAGMTWLSGLALPDTSSNEDEQEVLPVLRLSPESRLPSRGYPDDAGLDLYVVGNHTIGRDAFLDIPCGVAVELPPWGWGFLTGRSSTLRQKGLLVQTGIIDAGYRGPLFAGVQNLRPDAVEIKDGERLAQLIVLPNMTQDLDPKWVEQLAEHKRGQNGFGSTGA